ncbi:MAG: hypothetical protein JNM78_18060 [Cyclobacteriaceae bacterium]|nr:hypothetical protein [Cyclobacteriaceae bacterium]
MLDQLTKLVEQLAGDAIVKNGAIPDQFKNEAIQEVSGSIFNSLKGQVSQGNIPQVVSMFQGGASTSSLTSNPIVKQIISSVAGTFASKFGMQSAQAQSIVSSLVPTVMSQLISKTNDEKDNSFDLTDMMKSMSGNSSLDLGSLMGSVTGDSSTSNSLGDLGGLAGKLFGK